MQERREKLERTKKRKILMGRKMVMRKRYMRGGSKLKGTNNLERL